MSRMRLTPPPLVYAALTVACLLAAPEPGAPGAGAGMRTPEFARLRMGEALIHGSRDIFIGHSMPLAGMILALIENHTPPQARLALAALLRAAPAGLAFQLGHTMGGPLGGALALAAGWGLFDPRRAAPIDETLLYGISMLIVANILLWETRRPSPRRAGVLGLAIGLGMLLRTPLFLFPLWRAVQDRLTRRDPARAWRRRAAALIVGALLPLLPRTWASWRAENVFAVLEGDRARPIVVQGALGLVSAIDGDYMALGRIAFDDNVMVWVAGELRREPVRYVRAVGGRLKLVLEQHPLLAILAAVSSLAASRQAEVRALFGLAVYYLALTCSMAVTPRYVEPLWPILAAMAGGVARRGRESREPALGLAWGFFAALAVIGLAAAGELLAYPGRVADQPGTDRRMLVRFPEDGWAHYLPGRRALDRARPSEAAPLLSRAAALSPNIPEFAFDRTLAVAAAGRATPALISGLCPQPDQPCSIETGVLRTLWSLERGDSSGAARGYAETNRIWLRGVYPEGERPSDKLVEDRIIRMDRRVPVYLRHLLGAWPEPERIRLMTAFDALEPVPELLFDRAHLARRRGDVRTAGEAMRRLTAMASRWPPPARAWAQKARASCEAGEEPDVSMALFREALTLAPLPPEKRAVLDLKNRPAPSAPPRPLRPPPRPRGRTDLPAARKPPPAVSTAPAAPQRPHPALAFLDRAAAAVARGNHAEARKALGRAEGLSRGPGSAMVLWRAGMLYADVRDFRAALRLLDVCVKQAPRDALFLKDRGVVLSRLGRRAEALADLEASVGLDPDRMEAVASLGAAYQTAGRRADALALYERTLRRRSVSDNNPVRDVIAQELLRLRSR